MARINPHKLFVGAFVPSWLMGLPDLSPGAKLCYAQLCLFAGADGVAFPKQDTLAEALGTSVRQAQRYVEELCEKGLIEIERTGLQAANRYYFLVHEGMGMSYPNTTDMSYPETTDMSCPNIKERKQSIENTIKETHDKVKGFDPLSEPLPECLQTTLGRDAWKAWCDSRREIKKPLTPTAVRLQLRGLAECSNPVGVLMRAAQNGWHGLNITDKDKGKPTPRPRTEARLPA